MKKICLCCGKTTSHLSLPLELINDQILCRDCVEDSVIYDFNKIYPQMPEETFAQLKNKIISNCQSSLTKEALDCLIATMDMKHTASYSTASNDTAKTKELLSNTLGMFSNIGGKIKKLAIVFTCLGFLGSLLVGVPLTVLLSDFSPEATIVGIVITLMGFLFSWTSSFILYGFGQLITNSDKLVQMSNDK